MMAKRILPILLVIFSALLIWGCSGDSGSGPAPLDEEQIPDESGEETAPSGAEPVPPSAPTNVAASPGDTEITISWDASDGADSYNLYWATDSGVTAATGTLIEPAASPYPHTGLTNGTAYYYVVTSVNADGESVESVEVNATPFFAGALAAGFHHTVAVESDGKLWTWGLGDLGQLGNGSNFPISNPPRQAGTESDWRAVAAGSTHSVALKSNGTLWAWGSNTKGQLGVPTAAIYEYTYEWGTFDYITYYYPYSSIPVRVDTDRDWSAVTAGASHTLALKSDGTLWAWGDNENGQLGIPTTDECSLEEFHRHDINNYETIFLYYQCSPSPVQVGTESDWSAVSAGYDYIMALKSNGTLWAWGGNSTGQLGDGTTDHQSTPVQVGTETNWTAIAAGGGYRSSHAVALKSDGTLWAWGDNYSGQLGDGTTVTQSSPVQVGTESDWSVVAVGDWHTVALKSNGTFWAWGGNFNGELGDGTRDDSFSPVQVIFP